MKFDNKNTSIIIPWFAFLPTNVEIEDETYSKVIWLEWYSKHYWYNPYYSFYKLSKNSNIFRKQYKR